MMFYVLTAKKFFTYQQSQAILRSWDTILKGFIVSADLQVIFRTQCTSWQHICARNFWYPTPFIRKAALLLFYILQNYYRNKSLMFYKLWYQDSKSQESQRRCRLINYLKTRYKIIFWLDNIKECQFSVTLHCLVSKASLPFLFFFHWYYIPGWGLTSWVPATPLLT